MTKAGVKPQPGAAALSDPLAILDHLSGAVFLIDPAWRLRWQNAGAAALLAGRSAAGETLWSVLPGLAETPLGTALREAMATGTAAEASGALPPLEGWFEVQAAPLPE